MATAEPSKGLLLSSNLSCNSVQSMEQLISVNVPAFERGDARRHRDELNTTLNQLPEQPKQDYSTLSLGHSLSALSIPRPLREILYNELENSCCTKKCLLWSAHDYPVQLLRLMEEAKDHADKRASHSAQSTVDRRTGFAPRSVSRMDRPSRMMPQTTAARAHAPKEGGRQTPNSGAFSRRTCNL